MKWLTNFFTTSIGRKQLMALTGLGLSGFLVIHLSGQLLLLAGDGGVLFNQYAEWISSQIWINPARAGLLLILIIHVSLAFQLSSENRKARGTPYYYKSASDATYASRHMLLTGVLILGFVVIHLFNFTWADASGPGGLYGLVTQYFANPVWSSFYVLCMIVLAYHLVHALQSVFQTFGIRHKKFTPLIRGICMILAVGLPAAFASIPIWFAISMGGL